MAENGKLRLRILDSDRQFLRQSVEIRLFHMVLSDHRVVRADASEEIIITELYAAPQGLYRIEVILPNDDVVSQFVNIQASGFTDLEIVVGRSKGVIFRLPGDTEPDRTAVQPGDSLDVEVHGLRAGRAYQLKVRDGSGNVLFASSLVSNSAGAIEKTTLWPQMGLDDLQGKERFPVEEAVNRLRGKRFSVALSEGDKELGRREITFAGALTRPILVATNAQGFLQNAVMAGADDVHFTALNVPFQGNVRVYMVPRQHTWREGNAFVAVVLVGGRAAVADAQVDDQARIQVRVAAGSELQTGAYDFIIRQIRYGYEDDEEFRLRANDLVTRNLTGLVARGDFMASKKVRGGCSNTMPIAGRVIFGPPYFKYGDTFQLGENIFGALDPLALAPSLVGKMVALYVIQHKTPAQWSVDTSLTNLAVLGGNAAVQKFLTQPGCINFNDRLLWPNANQVGDYDIVADFGNNTSNPAAFVPDNNYDMPNDICDGYFVPGFRVVPDPTTDTQFANSGSFSYDDGPITVTDDWGQVTLDEKAIVFFPADAPGATSPGQISAAQPNYPLLVIVHGNSLDTNSYLGYNYLLDFWAKNGFIAASVHCDPGMAATGRARVLFQHINSLKAKFGATLQNNIGIMGHSRGGEAVLAALRLNHNEALGNNFLAVICLAPSDWILQETMQQPWAVPLQVIYGSMDGDITGGPPLPMQTGFSIYDRASGANKSMVFVYGSIHDRYNTVWGSGDLGFGHLGGTDFAKVISQAAHQTIAQGYMTAFYRRQMRGETQWEGIFAGEWRPVAVDAADGGTVKTYHQYELAANRDVDDFDGAHTATSWQTSTIGGAVTDDGTLPAQPADDNLWTLDSSSPHQTGGLQLHWNSTAEHLRFDLPAGQQDVSGFSVLSFRITQKNGSPSNVAGATQDLYVTLKSGNGKSRSIRAAAFDEIPYPDQRFFPQFTKSAMRTVRIPLSSYKIAVIFTDPVDLTNLVSISFDFGLRNAGEIEVDSIEFSN